MKVLIVDDDAALLDALAVGFQLQWEDAEVLTANDGGAGLERFFESSPDVVLLDVNLPDCNGFELAPLLADARPDAQIIITSTREGDGLDGLARRSGARGFLPKAELSGAAIGELLE